MGYSLGSFCVSLPGALPPALALGATYWDQALVGSKSHVCRRPARLADSQQGKGSRLNPWLPAPLFKRLSQPTDIPVSSSHMHDGASQQRHVLPLIICLSWSNLFASIRGSSCMFLLRSLCAAGTQHIREEPDRIIPGQRFPVAFVLILLNT